MLWPFAIAARAASPQLSALTPPGAQRGTETDFVIEGQHLSDAKSLLFYSSGFEVTKVEIVDDKKIKAHVKIATDCALGEHALRIWTASGVSDLKTLHVGPFPNVDEKEPNHDAAHAQKIPLNVTVNGVIKGEESDWFSVEAKKGERLTAEVEGMRLGWAMFDPWLAIRKADGTALARCDDSSLFLQDPLASIIAPEDGTYLIELRSADYDGAGNSKYRLHVGNFPQPLAAYPAGGQTGDNLVVKLIGDISGANEKRVQLPAQPDENFAVFADADGLTAPAANKIRVSPFPNVLESEPNNSVKQTTTTDKQLPLAFNGVIAEKGDADFFKFTAKKDQQLDIAVFARRLRSPLDSVLEVFDANGKKLAGNDDTTGPDSALRFKVPADGDYCLSVRDQLGRGGPVFVYRVEVTVPQAEIAFAIPEVVKNSQERQTIVIPRGNRFATMLRAQRKDFDGEFSLDAKNLPSGATFASGPISGDSIPVVFDAATDAQGAANLCELSAKADGKPVRGHYGQAVDLVRSNPNDTVYYKTDVEKLAVAIAEEAPFKVEIVQPKTPLLQNGSMNLRVVATRAENFKGEIKVSMLYNPPGIGSQATVTIAADKNEIAIPLNANGDAKTRAWKITAVATADAGKGAVCVSSQLADLEIAKPFVTAQIERANVEQGQPVTVVCKLMQNTPFEGKAKIKLLGLPNKVTAPEMEITSADGEVKFNVATDATSPTGQNKSLFCQITFEKDGEQIIENTAQGGVLRIEKPAALAATEKR